MVTHIHQKRRMDQVNISHIIITSCCNSTLSIRHSDHVLYLFMPFIPLFYKKHSSSIFGSKNLACQKFLYKKGRPFSVVFLFFLFFYFCIQFTFSDYEIITLYTCIMYACFSSSCLSYI